MLSIGITGGIACGKSTVLKYIQQRGCSVFSADEAFKSIFDSDTVQSWLREQILLRKGEDALHNYEEVGKTLIRYLMLSEPQFKTDYEALVHPMVREAMLDAQADVSEVPLLFETGAESCFEHIWVIACEPETQIKRLMDRMECSRDYALAWINKQLPIQEKIERASRVIYTDQPLDKVYAVVDVALRDDLQLVRHVEKKEC